MDSLPNDVDSTALMAREEIRLTASASRGWLVTHAINRPFAEEFLDGRIHPGPFLLRIYPEKEKGKWFVNTWRLLRDEPLELDHRTGRSLLLTRLTSFSWEGRDCENFQMEKVLRGIGNFTTPPQAICVWTHCFCSVNGNCPVLHSRCVFRM